METVPLRALKLSSQELQLVHRIVSHDFHANLAKDAIPSNVFNQRYIHLIKIGSRKASSTDGFSRLGIYADWKYSESGEFYHYDTIKVIHFVDDLEMKLYSELRKIGAGIARQN